MKHNELPSILVIDDNPRFLRMAERSLGEKNFERVQLAGDVDQALDIISKSHPNLVLVDVHLENEELNGIELAELLRTRGYGDLLAIVTVDPSPTLLFQAARAGANDYIVKNDRLDLGKEALRIWERHHKGSPSAQSSPSAFDLSYLRSFGLTTGEILVLTEYTNGFPRYRELGERLGKSERQLRKTFSRICKKLRVDNLPQLAHVLTICALLMDNSK